MNPEWYTIHRLDTDLRVKCYKTLGYSKSNEVYEAVFVWYRFREELSRFFRRESKWILTKP